MIADEPLGEGVQRRDRSFVDLGHRLRRDGAGAGRLLELETDAIAQLGGRHLGERDRGDAPHRHARLDQLDDAPDQRCRLARAGTGLHEEGGGESGVHRLPRHLIGRHG